MHEDRMKSCEQELRGRHLQRVNHPNMKEIKASFKRVVETSNTSFFANRIIIWIGRLIICAFIWNQIL